MHQPALSLRFCILLLLIVLGVLQARFWFSDEGWSDLLRLRQSVSAQQEQNRILAERNSRLEADVNDLKQGDTAVEERARADLGMVRESESFFMLVTEPDSAVQGD